MMMITFEDLSARSQLPLGPRVQHRVATFAMAPSLSDAQVLSSYRRCEIGDALPKGTAESTTWEIRDRQGNKVWLLEWSGWLQIAVAFSPRQETPSDEDIIWAYRSFERSLRSGAQGSFR